MRVVCARCQVGCVGIELCEGARIGDVLVGQIVDVAIFCGFGFVVIVHDGRLCLPGLLRAMLGLGGGRFRLIFRLALIVGRFGSIQQIVDFVPRPVEGALDPAGCTLGRPIDESHGTFRELNEQADEQDLLLDFIFLVLDEVRELCQDHLPEYFGAWVILGGLASVASDVRVRAFRSDASFAVELQLPLLLRGDPDLEIPSIGLQFVGLEREDGDRDTMTEEPSTTFQVTPFCDAERRRHKETRNSAVLRRIVLYPHQRQRDGRK
mmetsp:Transcript_8666/g.23420  ORF Transcript_8666/g.23420 Transcript_8666/m.23420 type:complete len:265 (+) Transcript_8666:348-1142(+)